MCALYSSFIAIFLLVNVIEISEQLSANSSDLVVVNVTQSDKSVIPKLEEKSKYAFTGINKEDISKKIKTLDNFVRNKVVDLDSEKAEQETAIQALTRKICETAKKLLGQKTKSSDIKNLLIIAAALDRLKNNKKGPSRIKDGVIRPDLYSPRVNGDPDGNGPSIIHGLEENKYQHNKPPYAHVTGNPQISGTNVFRHDYTKNDEYYSEDFDSSDDDSQSVYDDKPYANYPKHEYQHIPAKNDVSHYAWTSKHSQNFETDLDFNEYDFAPHFVSHVLKEYDFEPHALNQNADRPKYELKRRPRPFTKDSTYTNKQSSASSMPSDILQKDTLIADQDKNLDVARQNIEGIPFAPQNVYNQKPYDGEKAQNWIPAHLPPNTKEGNYFNPISAKPPKHATWANQKFGPDHLFSEEDKITSPQDYEIYKQNSGGILHKPNLNPSNGWYNVHRPKTFEGSQFLQRFPFPYIPVNHVKAKTDKLIPDKDKTINTNVEEVKGSMLEPIASGRLNVVNKHFYEVRVRPDTKESNYYHPAAKSDVLEINKQDKIPPVPEKYDIGLENLDGGFGRESILHRNPYADTSKDFFLNVRPVDLKYGTKIFQEKNELNQYHHKNDGTVLEDQYRDVVQNRNNFGYAWDSATENVRSRNTIPTPEDLNIQLLKLINELKEEYPTPYVNRHIHEHSDKLKFPIDEKNFFNYLENKNNNEVNGIGKWYPENYLNNGHTHDNDIISQSQIKVEQNHKTSHPSSNDSKHKTFHGTKWNIEMSDIPIKNNNQGIHVDKFNHSDIKNSENNTNSHKDLSQDIAGTDSSAVIRDSLATFCNKPHAERSKINEIPHHTNPQDADENMIKILMQMLIHFKMFGSSADNRDEMTKFLLENFKWNVKGDCEIKAYGDVLKLVVDFLGYLSREI